MDVWQCKLDVQEQACNYIYSGHGTMCLSFMYNMPTKYSTLFVYVMTSGHRQLVWEASKQTDGWTEAAVFLSYNDTLQV